MGDGPSYLVAPGEPDESMTGGFTNPIEIFDWMSPSAWINGIIEKTTGFDFIGSCTEFVTGDWEALYKFGDAMNALAQFMQQVGIELQAGAEKMDSSWDGNASDAAYNYFTALAQATSSQQGALYASEKGYHDAARGAWQLSNQLGNLAQAVIDKAILIGVSAAAGTVTASTGVGAVVGYSMAAYQAVELVKIVNKASTLINTAGTVILGVFGGGMAFAGQGGDLSAVPLPSTAYAQPGA